MALCGIIPLRLDLGGIAGLIEAALSRSSTRASASYPLSAISVSALIVSISMSASSRSQA